VRPLCRPFQLLFINSQIDHPILPGSIRSYQHFLDLTS